MRITEATFAGSCTRVDGKPKLRLPEFAFIGRSNVGKSSLINMLTGNSRLAMTSSTPGKTKCINHFLINRSWYLVDLPGYGYAKVGKKGRDSIADVIRDYILHSGEMVVLLVLIDSRHDIGRIDLDFLAELGEHGIPFALVFTKCDKSGPNALESQLERDREILSREWEELPPMFRTSAQTGQGRDSLLDYIQTLLASVKL